MYLALGRLSNAREKRISTASLQFNMPSSGRHNGTIDVTEVGEISVHGLNRAALYVIADKNQVKVYFLYYC